LKKFSSFFLFGAPNFEVHVQGFFFKIIILI
jgi:hypothetical protein